MIISLRGTYGAGKTTVVRALMDAYGPAVPLFAKQAVNGRKHDGYHLPSVNLFVVGDYQTTWKGFGGCDTIKDMDYIQSLIEENEVFGRHVLFEGAMVGVLKQRWLDFAQGRDFRWLFLNTPLETCIERIKQRREAAGNTKPLNTANTEDYYRRCVRMIDYLRTMKYPNIAVCDGDEAVKIVSFWLEHPNDFVPPFQPKKGTLLDVVPAYEELPLPVMPLPPKETMDRIEAAKPRLVLRRRP